jgi:hypothetical protein
MPLYRVAQNLTRDLFIVRLLAKLSQLMSLYRVAQNCMRFIHWSVTYETLSTDQFTPGGDLQNSLNL